MKSLLSKILLSLVASIVVALLVVLLLTRIGLQRGLLEYLDRQEVAQLENLVPELIELYQQQGSWDFLRGYPWRWNRLLRITRPPMVGVPTGRGDPDRVRPPAQVRQARADYMLQRSRLFLLDETKARVAGALVKEGVVPKMQAITVEQRVVGWIGFTPVRARLPAEAQRFLRDQVRVLLVSLLVALAVAAVLGFLLARHLSRPVAQLASAVRELSRGEYSARAPIRTQDEIGALGKDVNQLAETLQKNQSARRRWMADIAHELRTPVAILKGEIEALVDGVRQSNASLTASLREEVDHLSGLIDDLQTLALSDSGALDFRMDELDIGKLAEQTTLPYQARLADRHIQLETHVAHGLQITGDAQRLRQMFHNLLENSCRYVESGGRVSLRVSGDEKQVQIRLEDSGPGVGPEQLDRLFERFYRAERSRTRATGGSGLGLAICARIVEGHGGRIRAKQSCLGGLGIQIDLPV